MFQEAPFGAVGISFLLPPNHDKQQHNTTGERKNKTALYLNKWFVISWGKDQFVSIINSPFPLLFFFFFHFLPICSFFVFYLLFVLYTLKKWIQLNRSTRRYTVDAPSKCFCHYSVLTCNKPHLPRLRRTHVSSFWPFCRVPTWLFWACIHICRKLHHYMNNQSWTATTRVLDSFEWHLLFIIILLSGALVVLGWGVEAIVFLRFTLNASRAPVSNWHVKDIEQHFSKWQQSNNCSLV